MTIREVYDAVMVECNKVNAPNITVEEFNYLVNKTIVAFANERYNFYNVNQQLSDDLRVLLKPTKFSFIASTWNKAASSVVTTDSDGNGTPDGVYVSSITDLYDGRTVSVNSDGSDPFTVSLESPPTFPYRISTSPTGKSAGDTIYIETPQLINTDYDQDATIDQQILKLSLPASDYFHLISCRTHWSGQKYNRAATRLSFPAKRLTYDMLDTIENNVYMRPRYSRPYYMVRDHQGNSGVTGYNPAGFRGNQNRPRIDLYLGAPETGITLESIEINYLKLPELVTLDEMDVWQRGSDGSQVLEFPDYLKNQIVKKIVDYILEQTRDPRVQTHSAFNQEIPAVPFEMQRPPQPNNQQNQQ